MGGRVTETFRNNSNFKKKFITYEYLASKQETLSIAAHSVIEYLPLNQKWSD
jgi:hypothetical protein